MAAASEPPAEVPMPTRHPTVYDEREVQIAGEKEEVEADAAPAEHRAPGDSSQKDEGSKDKIDGAAQGDVGEGTMGEKQPPQACEEEKQKGDMAQEPGPTQTRAVPQEAAQQQATYGTAQECHGRGHAEGPSLL